MSGGLHIENRIVGYGTEAPDQLLANPGNWRIHPKHQQVALLALLGEVGWVQSVIVNRRTGHLVDGHLRATLAMQQGVESVPVVYVDLDANEEATILAALDPVGALAVADGAKKRALLDSILTTSPEVQRFLDSLSAGTTEEPEQKPKRLTFKLTPEDHALVVEKLAWVQGERQLDDIAQALVALCKGIGP